MKDVDADIEKGAVVAKSNRLHARNSNQAGPEYSEQRGPEHEAEGVDEEVLISNELASFDELVVWAHDTLPEDKNDPYIKAAEEWIRFAKQVPFQLSRSSIRYRLTRAQGTLCP